MPVNPYECDATSSGNSTNEILIGKSESSSRTEFEPLKVSHIQVRPLTRQELFWHFLGNEMSALVHCSTSSSLRGLIRFSLYATWCMDVAAKVGKRLYGLSFEIVFLCDNVIVNSIMIWLSM